VAISTACGALDWIVVETTNAAQACIELLRRKNAGLATCLIMVTLLYFLLRLTMILMQISLLGKLFVYILQEKQTHLMHKIKEKVKSPEGVPRLFDLVQVKDDRMKLAFFHALGNTVVASNLDQVSLNYSVCSSAICFRGRCL
jgi:structural maintenance of chromosome 4